jgi:hypothetical protein
VALADARRSWPAQSSYLAQHGCRFRLIIASGALISMTANTRATARPRCCSDALQPTGITWLLIDDYGLLPAPGAAATVRLASVQTLDSPALTSLGTVVSPVGPARPGEIVLKLQMFYETGGTIQVEVVQGAVEMLPLPSGQQAELVLQPARRIDIGLGPGKGGPRVKVNGGTLGLIIDARGRPLVLPVDPAERMDRVQQWLWDMGG